MALRCRCCKVKEGDQGFRFADKDSEEAHEQVLTFVKRNYHEVETFRALDGAQVSLCSIR